MNVLNKNYYFPVLVILLIMSLVMTSCSGNGSSVVQPDGLLTLNSEGQLSPEFCEQNGLVGKNIMFESRYCPHCQKALPVFEKVCSDLGSDCEVLDLADDVNIEKMYSYGLTVQFTPTFLIDCKYFVGEKSEDNLRAYFVD